MASEPKIWQVPAGPYKTDFFKFRSDFSSSLRSNKPYPIQRLFNLFPINPVNESAKDQLLARKELKLQGGIITSLGRFVDAKFNDDSVGLLGIYFPKNIKASAISHGSPSPMLEIKSTGQPIKVTFYEFPPYVGFPNMTQFDLKTITISADEVTFLFSTADNGKDLLIRGDLNKFAEPKKASSNYRSPGVKLTGWKLVKFVAESTHNDSICGPLGDAMKTCPNEDGGKWFAFCDQQHMPACEGACFRLRKNASDAWNDATRHDQLCHGGQKTASVIEAH